MSPKLSGTTPELRPAKLAIIAAVIGLIGCSPNSFGTKSSLSQIYTQNETKFTRIVVEYVRRTRDWPDDSYTVQLNRRDNKTLVYWVLYTGDNLRVPGGGGKSFEAILDPETKRVEKELHFQ